MHIGREALVYPKARGEQGSDARGAGARRQWHKTGTPNVMFPQTHKERVGSCETAGLMCINPETNEKTRARERQICDRREKATFPATRNMESR